MSAAALPSDELAGLLQRVARGDRTAFSDLYDEVSATVFGLANRVVRDRGIAADVTQEVMVTVWRRAGDYDPHRGRVMSWIATITRRKAIDVVRSREASRRREAREPLPPRAPDPVVESVDRAEEHHEVRLALEALTDKELAVITLAFYDDLTYREIATRLDIPVNTVKTRARSGLLRLSERMGGTRV